MIEKLLNVAQEIVDLCNLSLNDKANPNFEVITVVKREMESLIASLKTDKKAIVLNKERHIWASRVIGDSANFDYDNNIFDKVLEFKNLCRKLKKDEIIVLY